MLQTSLCYIQRDKKYLMLHRVKKQKDSNAGKWIGVGGKFEEGESPEECMCREVREETGIEVESYQYRGIVTFVSDQYETEYMHLFTVKEFIGAPGECEEGDLAWIPVADLWKLPSWEGDAFFLTMLLRETPFFSMKLVYEGERVRDAFLNGKRMLQTPRLLLRPWLASDVRSLYKYARSPEVGPAAGWPAHRTEAESRRVIETTLSEPDVYALVLKQTGEPVGSIGLQNFSPAGAPEKSAEIGYWIGKPFWGQGLVPEAVREIQRLAFCRYGMEALWCGYYDGNDKSRRVQEKCGFRYDHTVEEKERPLLHDTCTEHYTRLTRDSYLHDRNA